MKKLPKSSFPKVRTSFSLDYEVVSVLDDFSKVIGMNKSRALNDIILMVEPQLRVVIEEFKTFLEKIDKAMPITEDQLDLFMGRLQRNLFASFQEEMEEEK